MEFGTVFLQVAMLFSIMIVGFVSAKMHIFSEKATKDLSALLIYVATPALVISSMIREFEERMIIDALLGLGIGLAAFATSMFINMGLSKLLKVKDGRRGLWIVATSFSNSGYMGFPMALALFGKDGLFIAAFVNLAQNILMYTWGITVVQNDSNCEDKKAPLWKRLFTSVNVSIVIGMIIFFCQIPVPEAVSDVISKIAGLVTPLSMIIVGINISKYKFREVFKDKDAITSSLVHLLLMPLILLVIFKFVPFAEGSLVPKVVVLLFAMSLPTTSQAFADMFDSDSAYASRAIFISNVLVLITCPLIMTLV